MMITNKSKDPPGYKVGKLDIEAPTIAEANENATETKVSSKENIRTPPSDDTSESDGGQFAGDGQSDVSQETSVSDFSDLEAQTIPGFPENMPSIASLKASRDAKATSNKDDKNSEERSTALVEAKPVQSRPAEPSPPRLRAEDYPRAYPIEPEYAPPSPPPLLSQVEEQQDIEQQPDRKRYWIWISAFLALLVVILAIVFGVVLGRVGTKDPSPTPAPTVPPTVPPTILDELVALFSSTSPATATVLQDKKSNQYRAMEWLAKDVQENGFDLTNNEADRILTRGSLAILFYSTNGDGWDNSTGWLDHGISECDWYRVECTSALVTKFDLGWKSSVNAGNNLNGPLPREVHLLTDLEYLDVDDNSISGTIATEIGRLTNLKYLDTGWNSISGNIATEFGRLTNLRELWLNSNQFSGTLPSEFGLLTNLKVLSVHTNSLTGTVPTELGQLKQLELLYLHDNEFTGQVPSQVCAIVSLTELDADCGGSPPEIECPCCTECCPGSTEITCE